MPKNTTTTTDEAAYCPYEANGYANREEYLESLAEEYGDAVYMAADLLGPNEDFDGLVTSLEDGDFDY